MKNGYFQYYKSKPLMGLLATTAIVTFLLSKNFALSVSILGTLTLIIIIITQFLWRYKPFKWLFWIDDFSGRYEGKIIFQRRDENCVIARGELDHVKIICQTGSRITITSFTRKSDGNISSQSVSKGFFVECTEDKMHFRMIYTYFNEGSSEQGFPGHYGTEIIKFIKNGKEKQLSGGYFTNRLPYPTKGEFKDLKWVSKNTNHEF